MSDVQDTFSTVFDEDEQRTIHAEHMLRQARERHPNFDAVMTDEMAGKILNDPAHAEAVRIARDPMTAALNIAGNLELDDAVKGRNPARQTELQEFLGGDR